MSNQLSSEKSPYLLQHKDNPVSWFPWCGEAFEKAGQENKPIFLSIGYSTCHWCHVMAHESFEDEEVAALLNREYVCIKVDREERPDIDAIYMNVCQTLTGSGGWPLTVLMTPEQRPFYAGTYFPKRSRWGQVGLIELLEGIADLWKRDRERLARMGEEITETVRRRNPADSKEPKKDIIHAAYQVFERQFDSRWGGFGMAPKFPTPHNLLFLMRYAAIENEKNALRMAEVTLEAMAKGGIFDHIGGGFSRYSTDEKWLVPHFEKMLYDNALLILAYLEAYQMTGKECYADIVLRTADYILRELTDGQGGFYCGQDADSEGVEGKYYVFTPEEVKAALGETDGEEFCRLYHITQNGNFEGKSIPNRIDGKEGGWQKGDSRLEKLYQRRIRRTQLHKDDKILLSWNAWTILALCRASRVLGDKRFLQAAQRAQRFIEGNMADEKNRLFLRYRDGEAAHMGQLEDYAVYALALAELYQTTFEAAYLEKAVYRAGQMMAYFEDRGEGGYFITSLDAEQLIMRPKETYDGAIPSGNSAAAMVLQRLAFLTGEQKWRDASVRQFRFLAAELGGYPAGHSYALLAMTEALYPHKELICAVAHKAPEALWQCHQRLPAYGWTVLVKNKANSQALSQCAPFTAEYPVPEGEPVYYLCEGGACNAPVTDLPALLKRCGIAI